MKAPRKMFAPVSTQDMAERDWDACDFIIVSGDAYVDHPAFAAALMTRLLESRGFRVGIIAQPYPWDKAESYTVLGRPKLGFLVSAGAMDSMVNHYTAGKKPRSDDAYSPGGKAGLRPDRAVLKYVNGLRSAYKQIPVIIGGIEASLRRFTHYDYWSDTLKKPILPDSKADLLVFGMGEVPLLDIAARLAKQNETSGGVWPPDLAGIRGTMRVVHLGEDAAPGEYIALPSHDEQLADKTVFLDAWRLQSGEVDAFRGRPLAESIGGGRWVLQEAPALPLGQDLLDAVHEFPYTRKWHPDYNAQGGIPALAEVQFSLESSRGCFGSCAFCAITYHQGRLVQGRTNESVLREAQSLLSHSDFKGYIHDVGGPSANFTQAACAKQETKGACADRQCLSPNACKALVVNHKPYRDLLRSLRNLSGVKKVFVRSGIRYDYLLLDKDRGFLDELCAYHVSGRLKIAPEHTVDSVLKLMGKPGQAVYEEFRSAFATSDAKTRNLTPGGRNPQELVPYFISSHPGATLEHALELALWLKKSGVRPESVQDFYPTPGTRATCMYYTGIDPDTNKNIYVARGEKERRMQRALSQFWIPANRPTVIEALTKLGRLDLLGRGGYCLLP